MKKFVFILIFYFINSSVYSQSFSLKSGLSLSNISASQADFDEDLRVGMIFGAVTQFGDDNIKYNVIRKKTKCRNKSLLLEVQYSM